MKVELDHLLKYENERVTSRFQEDYPDARLAPRQALAELMKYIWLCLKHHEDQMARPDDASLQFGCTMHPEMEEIDDMWHTFLLFTREYQVFCRDYLGGRFFHHEPLDASGEKISKERYARELSRYLSYIYDQLGEETLTRWFSG